MKKFLLHTITSVFFLSLFFFFTNEKVFSATGSIDPDNAGYKYAKHLDDGNQINFDCLNCSVSVSDDELTGYVWSESFGWINLSPAQSGVLNDGDGNLSGYAWGELAGWVNFNPVNGGVSIEEGFFNGEAWGENTGWIIFDCSDLVNSCVYTDWRPPSTNPPGGGGGGNDPACRDGEDNDGDGFEDYPEDLGCQSLNDNNEQLTACSDPDADNFNQQANIHDDSLCLYSPVLGCTDSIALNYNPGASVSDNSCVYGGCTNPSATNYNSNASVNDGSCFFSDTTPPPNAVLGCTDPFAQNFDSQVNFDNGSCVYPPPPVFGCTNPLAQNFNPNATSDNGSCNLPPVVLAPSTPPPSPGPASFIAGVIKHPKTEVGILAVILFLVGRGGAVYRLLASPLRVINSIPAILGLRRRRNPWGTVYDSVTKQPLDPVYVEVKDLSGKSVGTSITDIDGRYGFLLPMGVYKITAGKKDYLFPSQKLFGKTKDVIYENLYFGEEINQEKDEDVISKDIPLDPINFNWNEFEKSKNKKLFKFYSKLEVWISHIADISFYTGLFFSLYAVYFFPTTFNIVIISIYAFVLLLSFFGIKPRRPGYIYEEKTGAPVSFGLVRIFSASLGKEVAHSVVSKTGKYFSLIANGEYYLTVEKMAGEDRYQQVLKTENFTVTNGHINKNLKVV